MRDAALQEAEVTAKLKRALDERECRERNALSQTRPGLRLAHGDVVTVVETFGHNEAFLVEFNTSARKAKAAAQTCDWMGVLYPTELEMLGPASER